MIETIKHKGLKRLFEKGDRSKISPQNINKIERILARLDASIAVDDMRLPGYHLHELSGDMLGFYSVRVSGNWRIIFRFDDGNAFDVDLLDYH